MVLTYVDVPAGGSVQLDDGSHASVYVQNLGQRHCVFEPGGLTLRVAQTATVPVQYGVPLTVTAASATTIGYAVLALAAEPASPATALLVDGGSP